MRIATTAMGTVPAQLERVTQRLIKTTCIDRVLLAHVAQQGHVVLAHLGVEGLALVYVAVRDALTIVASEPLSISMPCELGSHLTSRTPALPYFSARSKMVHTFEYERTKLSD